MRNRLSPIYLCLGLFLLATSAFAQGHYLDRFDTAAYSNQDGSLNWSGDWSEADDSGGATGGNILITGGELTLDDQPNSGGEPSVARTADLSVFTSPRLKFDFRTTAGVDAGDAIVIEASLTGGAPYTVLETFTGISGATSGIRSYDLATLLGGTSSTVSIRFRVTALYGGTDETFAVNDLAIGDAPPTEIACDTDVSDLFVGVTGSSGFGTAGANQLFVINGATGISTSVDTLTVVPNHLAFDSEKQLVYYVDHTAASLYGYDLNDGSDTLIDSDITSIPGNGDPPAGFTGHDAGTWWQGRYYIIPHNGTSGETGDDLHYIEFDSTGLSISDSGLTQLALPAGDSHMGDFGDIIITQAGILYGSSTSGAGDELGGFWTADMNDATPTVSVLNAAYTGAQLALTGDEEIYGNDWTTGELALVNPTTGALTSTISVDFGGDFFDLAPVSPHTCDYGDLPDTYGTSLASDGPSHKAGVASNIYMGGVPDAEDDGQPTSDGTGDGGDEDGVTFLTPLIPGEVADIQVNASAVGVLNAWVDFNSDGDFGDSGEQIATNVALASGNNTLNDISVPASATGVMAARFRATLASGDGGGTSTGAAENGEVEDYMLSALGSRVWNDSVDGDGIQDGGEAGVAGVVVNLLESDGSTAVLTGDGSAVTATTDSNGDYSFPGVPPGSYTIEFVRPAGYEDFSPPNQGADDAVDSDAAQVGPTEGITAVITTAAAQNDGSVDAGLRALTAALITSTTAYVDGRSVVFEFETAYEAMTSGFEVFRWDRRIGDYVMVTERRIDALVSSPAGGVYRVADERAPLGEVLQYVVVEHEAGGRTQAYGPYRVVAGDRLNRPVLESAAMASPHRSPRLEARMDSARRLASAAAASTRSSRETRTRRSRRGGSSVVLQLDVDTTGLHYVSAADIATVGQVNPERVMRWISEGFLALENRGEEVAWTAASGLTGLYFYGEAIDSLYTTANTYWLRLAQRGATMASATGPPPQSSPGGSFESTELFEQDVFPSINTTTETEVDHWYWDGLDAASSEPSRTFDVSVPDAVVGSASMSLRLVGASNGGALVDHHAIVRVNGTEIGMTSWSAMERHETTLNFSSSLLTPTTTVEIEGILSGGSVASIFFIDGFDITYQRSYQAVGDELHLTGDGNSVVTVEGFATSDVLALDLSQPTAPRRVDGLLVEADGPGFRASLIPEEDDSPYLVTALSAARSGANLRRVESTVDLEADHHAYEHLVIAPAAWRTEAEDLAVYRSTHGNPSLAVDLEEIYNTFSDGIVTPWAIRDFLVYAHENWSKSPRLVMLAGRGTVDPRDLLGEGTNFLPTVLVGTPYGLAPMDSVLADLEGGDSVPEVAIGRLPIVSGAELASYGGRLEAYEAASGDWTDRALLLSDDTDQAGDFHSQSQAVEALLSTFTRQSVSLETMSIGDARAALQTAWNEGVQIVNWAGHGGVFTLADEQLLTTADLGALTNGDRLPIFSALTCSMGRSDHPTIESLAEGLVTDTDGGAIAVWAPSGLSFSGAAHDLNLYYAAVLDRADPGTSLGKIILGITRAFAASGGMPEMLQIYGITGDPAVKLH